MSLVTLAAMAILLSGCFGGAGGQSEPTYYDIPGNSTTNAGPAGASATPGLMLHIADVRAPGWLMTPAMQYRLAYADASQRLSYTESRWVAPPAELLEQVLKRGNISSIPGDVRIATDGCQLLVNLDEFIQVFDAPGSSRALLETRVALLAPRDHKLLAQRAFTQAASAGADARSGVAGFTVAIHELNTELNVWLVQLERDSPALIGRCNAASS
ncbi:MAG TPA: ABC-type transport auxiliary lipoprotein family protein [Rhodocyclaceae bacterium]|jgi:cholesterol transport system auxiliary component|nr:ABC-type transport auxiliary lipoprotein family protein [Rhodocyclaceae bacterium]